MCELGVDGLESCIFVELISRCYNCRGSSTVQLYVRYVQCSW